MKKIATLLLLFSSFFCLSQQSGTIIIDWSDNKEVSYGDFTINLPQFSTDNFNYNTATKELRYVKKFKENELINESSLQISGIVYESIDESKLSAIAKEKIPLKINATIKNSISRDQFYSILSICPFVKEGNNYKKIVSFSYSYTRENSSRLLNSNNTTTLTNSVLSSGNWYRFYVEKSGAYMITKSFLAELGINSDLINPKKIKIYGQGGRMVPLRNSDPYPFDIEENAIQVIGEEDNVFNNEDFVVFYAEGVDNWSNENYTHLNLYSDRSYYYINVEGQDGKRMQLIQQPTGNTTLNLTTFDDYQFHEIDATNIGRLGRIWFGESFSVDEEQEFNFVFPNVDTSSQANVTIHVGGNSFVDTKFTPTINGQAQSNLTLTTVTLNSPFVASQNTGNYTIPASQIINVKLNFDNGGVPTSKGYLDFITIKTKSNLSGYGKQFRFQYDNAAISSGIAEYQISNASGIEQIWDITDIYNTSKIVNSQSTIAIKSTLGSAKKYIAVDFNDLYLPLKEAQPRVFNQDLKGTIFLNSQGQFEDIDYLIITPFALYSQAESLANFHRNYSGLNVKVVNLDLIYQEFASGKQDIGAIRNFVKYVYNNASSPSERVKYLNLFGDASFDFKDRITNNTNIVPIYHAVNSYTSGEISFASDDYFGMMDPNEGNEDITNGSADIAVGRMIVSSVQQANEMVNKVFEYHDLKSYGSWRNNYVSISDDSDKGSDSTLQSKQNNLTDVIHQQKPFLNYKKILLDSYQQETSSGGERYPQAKEDIRNAFEKGALVFNYLGHGGEDGLTGERIWDKFDGLSFFNQYRYSLFITITCEFSRFDNPLRPTAGEYTYLNPIGGAISMITTIRSISQGSAEVFNDKLSEILFSYGSDNYPSIAEALRLAKAASNNNSSTGVVFYLGDPALMLAIPKPRIVLTKVNDIPTNQPIDNFEALAFVKLTGEIQDEVGNTLNNYNGELSVNIFDKQYIRTTFNNDGYSPAITFNNLGETIFRGNASINNGQFEFGFVVPKDIRIPLGNGRISFYSKRDQILLDKTGYNTDIKIGGINLNAVADTTPPRVRLYMNDESFVNGGITNESPFFLAFLEDEHGINTASGIGHDIVAILDGDETNPYILNDYYETELDDYTKGKIRFPFRNLALGLHTITLKAWDVYNNFITADIQFIVVSGESVTLSNVLNYPNPFVSHTQFWFSHNRPFEPLEVQVQVFTITGKVVKTINQSVTTEGFLSRDITWDGKDDFGDKIGKGVYVYKLTVKSSITGEKSEKIEKLVIL